MKNTSSQSSRWARNFERRFFAWQLAISEYKLGRIALTLIVAVRRPAKARFYINCLAHEISGSDSEQKND